MRMFFAALGLVVASIVPAWAQSFDDPVALVEFAYAQYTPESLAGFDLRAHASPELLALFEADDARTPEGEVGALDFDPVVNGQDFDLSDVEVTQTERTGEQALVAVSFSNMGTAQTLLFTLVATGDGWKIDEIESTEPGNEWKLTEILAASE